MSNTSVESTIEELEEQLKQAKETKRKAKNAKTSLDRKRKAIANAIAAYDVEYANTLKNLGWTEKVASANGLVNTNQTVTEARTMGLDQAKTTIQEQTDKASEHQDKPDDPTPDTQQEQAAEAQPQQTAPGVDEYENQSDPAPAGMGV